MRKLGLASAAFLALGTLTSLSLAQGQPPKADKAQPAKKDANAKKDAKDGATSDEVRRDPKGIKGISPFWEAVNKGDKAFVARDFEGAIAAYREAITAEPQNALGHYRMGEAQLAKGNASEAEQSWSAGLRFVGENHGLRAKLIFVLADLREQQKNYDDATARWDEYQKYVQSQPDSKGFPQTPPERKKRIEEWKKISAESAEVKKRIDARVKEADESMRKSSK
ncbi:MAG TPA: tetratricopeptide repeat protein [Polyangiaceae bacterium]|jgi:tetratricopeptide (TPR) repeat protein|nr:tetratricopeptide repeat protein [Polyangiaceae bacterium]